MKKMVIGIVGAGSCQASAFSIAHMAATCKNIDVVIVNDTDVIDKGILVPSDALIVDTRKEHLTYHPARNIGKSMATQHLATLKVKDSIPAYIHGDGPKGKGKGKTKSHGKFHK